MQVISIQNIQDRPIIDAIAPQDFLLIGDVSDGNQVKRTTVAQLTSYLIALIPTPQPVPTKQSLYLSSQVPALDSQNDNASYELAQQLQFAKSGTITAIRFYKATGETGAHIGKIWAANGDLLASVTFANETANGWQEQELSTPLNVLPGVNYLIGVNINAFYASTNVTPPQTITRGDISGSTNGLFGSAGNLPTSSFNNNYFRDVVFEANPS